MTLSILNASTVEIYTNTVIRKATCTIFISLSNICIFQKIKHSITISKYAYMFTQGFLDEWPALSQVRFSVFGEQCCKTAFFQQPFRIIFSCKGWLFPSIWHSEKFRFINCYRYKKKKKSCFFPPLSSVAITSHPCLTTKSTINKCRDTKFWLMLC